MAEGRNDEGSDHGGPGVRGLDSGRKPEREAKISQSRLAEELLEARRCHWWRGAGCEHSRLSGLMEMR